MYRLIRGLNADRFEVLFVCAEPRHAPVLPSKVLRSPRLDSRHASEARVSGLGFALLARQAT
jgi:hypothetical protein